MNRTAFVTGGAGGIGSKVCAALAERGYRVAVADLDGKNARQVAEQIVRAGGKAEGVAFDLASPNSVEEAVRLTHQVFGSLDILINIAGYGVSLRTPLLETTDEIWDRMMDINARGTFYCIRAVAPGMMERRWGRIINVSSGTYLKGTANRAAYIASKAAVVGLTRGLARELGECGITINAIAPGLTESPVMLADTPRAHLDKTVANRSIKRRLQPEDLINAFLFLAGEDSGMITGQTIVVNGGDAFL